MASPELSGTPLFREMGHSQTPDDPPFSRKRGVKNSPGHPFDEKKATPELSRTALFREKGYSKTLLEWASAVDTNVSSRLCSRSWAVYTHHSSTENNEEPCELLYAPDCQEEISVNHHFFRIKKLWFTRVTVFIE